MEIKYGLISADSHAAFHRDDFTSRMSAEKWGERIPHVAEKREDGGRADGWSIYGLPPRGDVCNCPAVMGDPFPTWPKVWEEVPALAYDPKERLKALDGDRVDAEVLFPNPPGGSYYEYGDAEFELACVQAYNDVLADWRRASDRYLPLAALPYLSDPKIVAKEVERSVTNGHRGVNVAGKAPKGLPHIAAPHWYPLWDICQELNVPIHFHGSANLDTAASAKKWDGYSVRQAHSAATSTSAVTPAQIIPHFIFSGLTERFPRLKVVFAEAGIGGLNYVLAACAHEWETRRLWTEGLATRPSEAVRRQMYVNFWFEAEGIKLREAIGVDNLMWESDFPHVASYYPRSWHEIERVLQGVSAADRRKLLFQNALKVYDIEATVRRVEASSSSAAV